MKIKVLPENDVPYKDENHRAGDIFEAEEKIARKFIAEGRAIECNPPKVEEIMLKQIPKNINLEEEE